jgi:hypothetical protein
MTTMKKQKHLRDYYAHTVSWRYRYCCLLFLFLILGIFKYATSRHTLGFSSGFGLGFSFQVCYLEAHVPGRDNAAPNLGGLDDDGVEEALSSHHRHWKEILKSQYLVTAQHKCTRILAFKKCVCVCVCVCACVCVYLGATSWTGDSCG